MIATQRLYVNHATGFSAKDPQEVCGDIWFNGTPEQRAAFEGGTSGRGKDEKPPGAWWDD